jgi:hypothetical protein
MRCGCTLQEKRRGTTFELCDVYRLQTLQRGLTTGTSSTSTGLPVLVLLVPVLVPVGLQFRKDRNYKLTNKWS